MSSRNESGDRTCIITASRMTSGYDRQKVIN
ncbi:uncharacterized protein METZ01_LOCUS199525, partial [marine metagenome]